MKFVAVRARCSVGVISPMISNFARGPLYFTLDAVIFTVKGGPRLLGVRR
jgi:hypothetical protein